MKLSLFALVLLASLLAAGCYCPMLSGRYGDAACFPPAHPQFCGAPDQRCACGPEGCQDCDSQRLAGGRHGFGGGRGARVQTPSNQAADYASPLPKFHPVPTRPVFEPVASYSAPVRLEWAPPAHGQTHAIR